MREHTLPENAPVDFSSPAWTFESFYVPCVFRPWASVLMEQISPQPGQRILDLACGTGVVARLIAAQTNGDAVVKGIDYSAPMLDVARSMSEQEQVDVEWVLGNAEDLPFADSSYELVLVQQGLQFFGNRKRAVAEMFRVLSSGGSVVSSTWTEVSNQPFNELFAGAIRRNLGISEAATAYSLGSRDELESLFDDAGFDSIEIERRGLEVCYPSPDQFVELGVASASAAVPELSTLDEKARRSLVSAIRADMEEAIRQFTRHGTIVAPMEAHVVVARKAGRANNR